MTNLSQDIINTTCVFQVIKMYILKDNIVNLVMKKLLYSWHITPPRVYIEYLIITLNNITYNNHDIIIIIIGTPF